MHTARLAICLLLMLPSPGRASAADLLRKCSGSWNHLWFIGTATSQLVVPSQLSPGGKWNTPSVNRYLASLAVQAERLKSESKGQFQYRFRLDSQANVKIEFAGPEPARQAFQNHLAQPPSTDSTRTEIMLVPLRNLSFTQETVSSQKLQEKRRTESTGTPVYPVRRPDHPPVMAVVDGHHRAMSYVDESNPDRNTLVPIRLLSPSEVNRLINRGGATVVQWPTELIDTTVLDHVGPRGILPRIIPRIESMDPW